MISFESYSQILSQGPKFYPIIICITMFLLSQISLIKLKSHTKLINERKYNLLFKKFESLFKVSQNGMRKVLILTFITLSPNLILRICQKFHLPMFKSMM